MPSEKRKELTRQIVIRLKEVIQDMSDAEVIQRMAEAGEQTSIATVRRIRAAGSEDAGFNYNLTIKPFARVFLELSSKPVDIEALETDADKDRGMLENIMQMKDLQMDDLRRQLQEAKADAQLKIDHLNGEIKELHRLLGERRDFILDLQADKRRSNRINLILSVLLALALAVIIGALIVDRLNPEVGFFWLDRAASYIQDGAHTAMEYLPGRGAARM